MVTAKVCMVIGTGTIGTLMREAERQRQRAREHEGALIAADEARPGARDRNRTGWRAGELEHRKGSPVGVYR